MLLAKTMSRRPVAKMETRRRKAVAGALQVRNQNAKAGARPRKARVKARAVEKNGHVMVKTTMKTKMPMAWKMTMQRTQLACIITSVSNQNTYFLILHPYKFCTRMLQESDGLIDDEEGAEDPEDDIDEEEEDSI